PGGAVAAEIGNENAMAALRQCRHYLVPGMNVVGKAVEKYDCQTKRVPAFQIADAEHRRIDGLCRPCCGDLTESTAHSGHAGGLEKRATTVLAYSFHCLLDHPTNKICVVSCCSIVSHRPFCKLSKNFANRCKYLCLNTRQSSSG